ncbi:unnamed protein product [Linum trigynum]|uniref:Uncharacterized protein n=1 Tax=Linum trigynum TaxID=586398 RepID=A0AAV2C9Y0_9ROSI
MDWPHNKQLGFSVALLLFLISAAIDGAGADATVMGTVFCDQCKDGQISLFDYPMSGVKVRMACADGNGETATSREETTNYFGGYTMRFDGTPDFSNCYAQLLEGGGGGTNSTCVAAAGPPKKLRLMFSMFGMEMYNVDSLLSQPAQPMSFCPNSPPSATPAQPARPPPSPPVPSSPPPALRLPPVPPLPPMPFVEASACSHQTWMAPEYKCYWRIVSPDTKVAVAFGLLAAQKYGNDLTLGQALLGRGDPYRTLLREATTSLLNSYNSLQFRYDAVNVVTRTNFALMGSERAVLLTALRFIRANSGAGGAACRMSPCK